MANRNSPMGFRPVRHRNGACFVTNAYSIAAAYGTKIHTYTAVVRSGSGNNVEVLAAGAADALGIFAGCEFDLPGQKRQWSKYWPANPDALNIIAHVWDDPELIFEAQYGNAAAQTPTEADLGTGIDLAVGTGDDVNGVSRSYLDHATKSALNGQFRIERLVPRDDNEMGDFAKFEVSINEHALMATGGLV